MDDLPDDVVWLVNAHLPSMEHVDLLLLLVRTSPRSLSGAQVCAVLRHDARGTAKRLEQFVAAGLAVAEVQHGERVFSYHPAGIREETAVKSLLDTYDVRPVSLIRFLYERPAAPTAVQQFAEAFRIGGRKRK